MKEFILKIFVALLIFLGCSSEPRWEGTKEVRDGIVYMHNTGEGLWRNKKKMVMEKILTIGVEEGEEDYILVNPRDIAIDKNDNIYICDVYDYCIKVYDQAGQFLRRIGRQGNGPGEFSLPARIVITNDDKLCVRGYNRISYFNLQGEYINRFKPNDQKIQYIATIPGNDNIFVSRLIRTGSIVEEHYVIIEYGNKGNVIRKFGEFVKMGSVPMGDWPSEAHISGLQEGKLLVVYQWAYRIDVYNKDSIRSLSITRDTEIFTEPEIFKSNRSGAELLATRSMMGDNSGLELPNGNFIVRIEDYGPNFLEKMKKWDWSVFRMIYDLYDSEGHYLQSFYWREKGEEVIIHIDKKGFAYTRSGADEIPRVRKYKISFVDK